MHSATIIRCFMRIYSSPIKSAKCTLNFSFKLIFSSIPQKDRIVYARPLHPWRALNEILSWCMPAKRRPPISVLGVLTKDGWDHRQKESRNLYQTQTIGDISWMSFRRNRQAGHRMTISLENDWGTCMRNIPSVSETMEIPSRASVQNTVLMRSMLLHILIAP